MMLLPIFSMLKNTVTTMDVVSAQETGLNFLWFWGLREEFVLNFVLSAKILLSKKE